MSTTVKKLLITILRNGVYSTDQSANITALEKALASGGSSEPDIPDVPDEPIVTTYTIISVLDNVASTNPSAVVNEGEKYTANLTAMDGYELDSVVITMGGVDITNAAYVDGVVAITSVTGNVIITASAVEKELEENNGWVNGEAYETEWMDGIKLANTGEEIVDDRMSVSGFLPCQDVSRMVTSDLYSNYQLWYYDANKNFLRRAPVSYVVNQTNIETYRDAYFVRTFKRIGTTNASIVPYRDDLLDESTAWEADKYYRLNWMDGVNINASTGEIIDGDMVASDLALCYGATSLQFSNSSRTFVTWYDAGKNFLSQETRQNITTSVSIPDGAYYFRLSNATTGCNFWVQLS